MMTLEELYETFDLIEDWEERYRVLIDLGRQLPPMPDEAKVEANRVRGCMSQVWMIARPHSKRSGAHEILADSDAHIVKGLIAILLMAYSNKSSEEIASVDINEIFTRLELETHISPNRRNGFYSMVERIRQLAHSPAA